MSQGNARIKPSRTKTTPPPLDRWDLLRDGLPIDHFYRRFVEVGREHCPRCEHHHLGIVKRSLGKHTGWEWCCMNCSQRWREPKITVGMTHRDSNPFKEPENPMISITEYKY
jgi:hypothetical protein